MIQYGLSADSWMLSTHGIRQRQEFPAPPRLCYVRGPAGIIIGLVEELR